VLSSPAFAAKIGVSMDKFDDNFLTVLRNRIADYAKTVPGLTLQIEDAKDDVSKQLSQVQNFIANGVTAIIVNPVDMTALLPLRASSAKILLNTSKPAPADEPVIDRLVRTILPRGITPAKPVPDHEHGGGHNPPVIHPRHAVRQRKKKRRSGASALQKAKTNQTWRSLLAYESAHPTQCEKFNRS
jgi:hypothetical protein